VVVATVVGGTAAEWVTTDVGATGVLGAVVGATGVVAAGGGVVVATGGTVVAGLATVATGTGATLGAAWDTFARWATEAPTGAEPEPEATRSATRVITRPTTMRRRKGRRWIRRFRTISVGSAQTIPSSPSSE
jgi:hypothetical protein